MKRKMSFPYAIFITLFFVSLFLSYQEKDKSNVYNLFDFYQGRENNSVILKTGTFSRDSADLIDWLIAYEKEHPVDFIIEHYIFDQKNQVSAIHFYIAAQDEDVRNLYLKNYPLPETFSLEKTGLSSERENGDFQRIFLFQRQIGMRIRSLEKLKTEENFPIESIHYFSDSAEEKKSFEEAFSGHFGNLIKNFGVAENESYAIDHELLRYSYYFCVVAAGLLIFMNCFYLSKKTSQIAVLRANGFRNQDMFLKIYGKESLKLLLLSCLLPLMLYGAVIHSVNIRALQFLAKLSSQVFIFYIIYLVIAWWGILFVQGFSLVALIKKRGFHQSILKFTFLLSIVFIVPLSSLLNQDIRMLFQEMLPSTIQLIQKQRNYKNIFFWEGFRSDSLAFDFDEDAYFMGEKSQINQAHQEVYERLMEENKLYFFRPKMIADALYRDYLVTFVNRAYLRSIELGKEEDFQEPDVLHLFMSSKDLRQGKWKGMELDPRFQRCVIHSYGTAHFEDYDHLEKSDTQDPILAFSTSREYSMIPAINSQVVFHDISIEELNQRLDSVGWKDRYVLVTGREQLQSYWFAWSKDLAKLMLTLLPGIMLVFVILDHLRYFYYVTYQKHFTLFYFHGWSVMRALRRFILGACVILATGVVLQMLILRSVMIYFDAYVAVILLLEILLLRKQYRNTHVQQALKGMGRE